MLSFNTVLFDLDGTLLPIDIDKFLDRYFKLIIREFSDLVAPEKFIKALNQSTGKMLKNDGERTNREVFINHFFRLIEVDNEKKVMDRFSEFYCKKYPKLKQGIESNRNVVELVNYFHKQDLQLVIATNPVFPPQANIERIKWAGLKPDIFSLITSYDNMHFAKPNINYYREILDKISRQPDECIMIGNDMQEDIVAQKIGIKSFLVEDFLIDREKESMNPYWRGTIVELVEYFQEEK